MSETSTSSRRKRKRQSATSGSQAPRLSGLPGGRYRPLDESDLALVDQVEEAWKDRKMRQDAQATTWLVQLEEALANPLHKKDEKAILKVATFVLTKGKLREPDKSRPYQKAVCRAVTGGETDAEHAQHAR